MCPKRSAEIIKPWKSDFTSSIFGKLLRGTGYTSYVLYQALISVKLYQAFASAKPSSIGVLKIIVICQSWSSNAQHLHCCARRLILDTSEGRLWIYLWNLKWYLHISYLNSDADTYCQSSRGPIIKKPASVSDHSSVISVCHSSTQDDSQPEIPPQPSLFSHASRWLTLISMKIRRICLYNAILMQSSKVFQIHERECKIHPTYDILLRPGG